jgi:8-oxo-dGTP diphosphatase
MPQPIGACAILINPAGQILLGKRKNSYKAGYYGLPGGRIELNESITSCIEREVFEETSLKLDTLEYLGVVRENQSEYDFIHFIFVARSVTGMPHLAEPEKCAGWEWKDLASLDIETVLPGHAAALRLFTEQLSFVDITTP